MQREKSYVSKFPNEMHALLTVRVGSTRLPGKCFLPFGESHVLDFVVDRCLQAGITPIVCTSNQQEDDALFNYAIKKKIKVFRGSLQNKLHRWSACAVHFNLDQFHALDVDDPFFSPKLVRKSIHELISESLDFVAPTTTSSMGAAAVGYSMTTSFALELAEAWDSRESIEMVDEIIKNKLGARGKILLADYAELSKVRLTLDYEEDYHLLAFLAREFGPFVNREEIEEYFVKNPDLFKINWFRNQDWSANQKRIRGEQGE